MTKKIVDTIRWAGLKFDKPVHDFRTMESLYYVEGPGSEHISLRYLELSEEYKATYADGNVSARCTSKDPVDALNNLSQVLNLARDTIANMVEEHRKTIPSPIPEEIKWRYLVLKKIPPPENGQLIIYSCEKIPILFLVFHKTERTWLASFGKANDVITITDKDPHLALNRLRDQITDISMDLNAFIKISSGLDT